MPITSLCYLLCYLDRLALSFVASITLILEKVEHRQRQGVECERRQRPIDRDRHDKLSVYHSSDGVSDIVYVSQIPRSLSLASATN